MKKYSVIIAGSRSCPENDIGIMNNIIYLMTNLLDKDIEIVSGTCKGADVLGENISKKYGYSLKQFPADWGKHGKSAGYIRNKEMAEYGTHLIALWDGKSKGTKLMIDLAKEKGLAVRIINI